MNAVTLRVPATTANMGPGFDTLGCALSLYNTITVSIEGKHLTFTGVDDAYCNRDNLVVAAYDAVMKKLGLSAESGLHITIRADIPVSRGLGSSAALLCAGATAANLLHGSSLTVEELLSVTTQLEGHPDNLAPAFFGGMTASAMNVDVPMTVRYRVSPDYSFVAIIPDYPLSTAKARSVLPSEVSRSDAVFNISRALLLAHALEHGEDEILRSALSDRIHQPYRESLIPGYEEAKAAAFQYGALGYCISGAGPTQLCVMKAENTGNLRPLTDAIHAFAPGWHVLALPIDSKGITVLNQ